MIYMYMTVCLIVLNLAQQKVGMLSVTCRDGLHVPVLAKSVKVKA